MIPKTIHQIWIGNNPISEEHKGFIQKWKEMYGDYTYVFWDNKRVDEENIIPQRKHKYFYSNEYPIVLKADILRYEIVRQRGGIYIDIDAEPLRKMDDCMLDCHFLGGRQSNNQVAIGIFGAEVGCSLLNEVSETIGDNIEKKLSERVPLTEIYLFTGPTFFDKVCEKYVGKDGYVFYPPKFFYPYWYEEMNRRNENFRVTCPDAYSVHHWAHSWKVV